MDGWADTIVAVASLAAVFFAVMGFRGLIEGVEGFSGRCEDCQRATVLPPPISHRCWRCRHSAAKTPQSELGVQSHTVG